MLESSLPGRWLAEPGQRVHADAPELVRNEFGGLGRVRWTSGSSCCLRRDWVLGLVSVVGRWGEKVLGLVGFQESRRVALEHPQIYSPNA